MPFSTHPLLRFRKLSPGALKPRRRKSYCGTLLLKASLKTHSRFLSLKRSRTCEFCRRNEFKGSRERIDDDPRRYRHRAVLKPMTVAAQTALAAGRRKSPHDRVTHNYLSY